MPSLGAFLFGRKRGKKEYSVSRMLKATFRLRMHVQGFRQTFFFLISKKFLPIAFISLFKHTNNAY
jgi:hypothetical protein